MCGAGYDVSGGSPARDLVFRGGGVSGVFSGWLENVQIQMETYRIV